MRRAPLPQALLVLALGALLGVALTWPTAARFATDLPGGPHKDGLEDAYQNVWNLWWTVEALSRPANPWVTDRFFHPEQPNLLFHTLSPVNTLMVAPVTALWGPIAGFNAVVIASFALGALGIWLLARERAGPGPALLAAIVYVASPFHMAAIVTDGQLQIFAHHWLPWYILFLLRALHGGPRRDGLLAGLFLVLTAWTDWYYTLFLLIFSAAAALFLLIGQLRGPQRAAALPALARAALPIGFVFALGAGPLIAPMLVEAARFDYMDSLPPDDPGRLSADLLAYLVPQRVHALWGAAPWDWGVSFTVNRRFYVGLTAALLALLAVTLRPAARPWGLAALGFGLLSLGASLRVNGVDTGLPLPYALLADAPIFRLTRQPDRFNVLVTIALGVLAAHGAAALLAVRPALARRAPLLLAALAALLLLEYWPAPIVTRAPAVPPFLASLPRTDDGALVELPFHVERPYRDAERMLFQTTHGRPISGGYHSRLYPQPQLGLPALRDMAAGRLDADIAAQPGGWPAALNALGYRYVVGYKQQPLGPISLQPADEAGFKALIEAGLGVDGPIFEDQWLIAYAVPPANPAPMIQLREGWGVLEQSPTGAPFRWLADTAELGLIVQEPGRYRLTLGTLPIDGPRTLRLRGPWGEQLLPIGSGQRRHELLLDLPAGRTILALSSVEPPTTGDAVSGNGDLRPVSVRFSGLSLELIGSTSP
jgi:hypothetical protein